MVKRAWSHDDIVMLIDMYESNPILWDCRSNEYKNRDHKNAALKEIAEVFNCKNEEVLRIMHNLRNQVRTEATKYKEVKKWHCWWRRKEYGNTSMQYVCNTNNDGQVNIKFSNSSTPPPTSCQDGIGGTPRRCYENPVLMWMQPHPATPQAEGHVYRRQQVPGIDTAALLLVLPSY
ncbi:hypothetical protein PR048_022650, partial [Dryococelus australis]